MTMDYVYVQNNKNETKRKEVFNDNLQIKK